MKSFMDENFLLKNQKHLNQLVSKNMQKAYVFNNFIMILMDNKKLVKFY